MILLADVGGTNARFALARHGAILPASVARLRGGDHASFDAALQTYMRQQGIAAVGAVCVAVAGPVAGGQARLTNRDWSFCEARLMQLCHADRALLINDMVALGHAVPGLSGAEVTTLREVSLMGPTNGQSLVVNAGTGFNICAVQVSRAGRITCLEAEYGHTRLPQSVTDDLQSQLPAPAPFPAPFHSVEELLAGRGLVRLHQARLHPAPGPNLGPNLCPNRGPNLGTEERAEDIVAAAARGDLDAVATCRLYARLLGLICRELALQFLPQDGLYLAGSVARSCEARMADFTGAFLAEPLMRQIAEATSIRLIRDDMAAIRGCLAALG